MIVVLIVAVVVLGLLAARRRAKRSLVAGLVSDRPAFTLAPPRRWSTRGRDHRL